MYIHIYIKIHRGFLKIAHAYKHMHIHYIYICNHQHVGLRNNNIAHQGTKLHVLFPNSIYIYYEWSDWSEAKLIEVIKYLRGNVNLRLPEEWKQCFPTRL